MRKSNAAIDVNGKEFIDSIEFEADSYFDKTFDRERIMETFYLIFSDKIDAVKPVVLEAYIAGAQFALSVLSKNVSKDVKPSTGEEENKTPSVKSKKTSSSKSTKKRPSEKHVMPKLGHRRKFSRETEISYIEDYISRRKTYTELKHLGVHWTNLKRWYDEYYDILKSKGLAS